MAILASKCPLFIAASVKKVSIAKWPTQLVSNIARAAVLFAIGNVLFIAAQPAMGVILAPLAVHHGWVS
jgi:hypothetical protein